MNADILIIVLLQNEDGVGGSLLVSNDGVDLTSVYLLETLGSVATTFVCTCKISNHSECIMSG